MACGDEPPEPKPVTSREVARPVIRVAPGSAGSATGSAAPVAKPIDKPIAKRFTRTEIVDVKRDETGWAFTVHFPHSSANTKHFCDRKHVDIERYQRGTWVDAIRPRGAARPCSSGPNGMVVLVEETTTLRWDGKTFGARAARGKYRAVIDRATAEFEID